MRRNLRICIICNGYAYRRQHDGGRYVASPFLHLRYHLGYVVERLYLCGATADKIEAAVKADKAYNGTPEIIRCESITAAVLKANEIAKAGDIVTLSPASASFDAYPNFVARGKHFKELVNNL